MSQGVRESGGRTRLAARALIVAALAAACVACLPASAEAAPVCNPPAITGNAAVGSTLTGTPGGCSGLPGTSVTLQWLRCSTAAETSCTQPLSQPAAGPVQYAPVAADVGRHILLRQVARDLLGETVASAITGVVDGPPVAAFSVSPTSTVVGRAVSFASSSRDPDGDPIAHAWDLDGDGQFDDGSQANVSHTYGSAGTYPVALRVTAGGQSSLAFKSVTVDPGPASGPGGGSNQRARRRGALRLMSPFPLVAIGGRLRDEGALITLLRVRAPRRTLVTVRCRGRGCPVRRWRKSTGRRRALRVRRFERALRAGIVLEVRITARNRIGKYTWIQIRRGRPPARVDHCLLPSRPRPVKCPRS
jgi:PKD domain-containing protein